MGAGHRNDQARERARAVKEQRDYPNEYRGFDRPWNPPSAFVAPGFPAEAPVYKGPIPPPPPGVAGAAGAAAGAGGGAALAIGGGGVALGLGLGAAVKTDIDKFKSTAEMPFYDPDQTFRPGGGWELHEWQNATKEVGWSDEDMQHDLETRQLADRAIDDWMRNQARRAWARQMGFGTTVTFGPSGQYDDAYEIIICGDNAGFSGPGDWGYNNVLDSHSPFPVTDFGPGSLQCGVSYFYPNGPNPATITHAQSTSFYNGRHIFTTGEPGTIVESWALRYAPPYQAINTTQFGEPGTGYTPIVFLDDYYGFGEPLSWPDMVAPVGTQPSLAQQQSRARLPRGKSRAGYVVPFSPRHPFTRVVMAPGSPPVTVPDQVIDPGTETVPGGVTIVPPGHPPGNPNADAEKEAKPWPQRLASMGFTAINVVTEAQDFLEAMHEALPKKLRSKGRNGGDVPPWIILQDIWDHWDHFDADLALENFINNQIEDAIYGRFFGAVSRTQKKAGITAGLSRGVKPREPWKLTVPEIHFANGQFGVEFGEWQIGGYE